MKFFSFIASFAMGFFCFAQQDSIIPVEFVAYWSKSDSNDFRITKINKVWQNEKLVNNDSVSYLANFTVTDSLSDQYRIKWKMKNQLINYLIPKRFQEGIDAPEVNEITYTTNDVGGFSKIENWEKTSEISINWLQNIIINDGNLNQFSHTLIPILKSEQGVKTLLFKELHYFHLLMGYQYYLGKPFEDVTISPNPLTSSPLRSNVKITVQSIDFKDSIIHVLHESKVNPDDAKETLEYIMKQMNIESKAEFDINHRINYEYDFSLSVPKYIKSVKNSIFKFGDINQYQEEIVKIELVKPINSK